MSPGDTTTFPAWTKKVAKIIGAALKHAGFELWRGLTLANPVDTGRSRANWTMLVNSKDARQLPPGKYKQPKLPAVGRVEAGDTVWLVNNLPYVQRLNEGWSKQAPAGWVDSAVVRVKQRVDGVIRAAAAELGGKGMSLDAAKRAIESWFAERWQPTAVPVAFDNVEVQLPVPPSAWARFVVVEAGSAQIDINPRPRVRYAGVVKLQLFVPRDEGTELARQLASIASDIFDGKRVPIAGEAVGAIRFGPPQAVPVGADGEWWQFAVSWEFYRDEIRAAA